MRFVFTCSYCVMNCFSSTSSLKRLKSKPEICGPLLKDIIHFSNLLVNIKSPNVFLYRMYSVKISQVFTKISITNKLSYRFISLNEVMNK